MGTMIRICKNHPMTVKYTRKELGEDVEISPNYPIPVNTAEQIGGVRQHEQVKDKVCNRICV